MAPAAGGQLSQTINFSLHMLTCQKDLFDLPDAVHYLNCATMGANLKSSMAAGVAGIARKSSPHTLTATDFFTDVDETRRLFAQLINCPDPARIALFPSVAYGMATVAKNLARKPGLRAGQEIVLLAEEFPSDVYAWEEVVQAQQLVVKTVAPPADFTPGRGAAWHAALHAAITERTCLVVAPPVHWVDGTRFDLAALGRRARAVGAWLVVDGSQALGATPFDVAAVQPDALVAATYKTLLGPYGLSLGYYGPAFDEGQPLEASWINRRGSDDFGQLATYQTAYRPGAIRYSMGQQSNFILLPMLQASLRQLLSWTPAAVEAYAASLVQPALPQLAALGAWVEEPAWRGQHLFGLRLPAQVSLERVRAALAAQHVSLSVRGSTLRVSVNVWNTPVDLAALVAALTEAA